jgi:hypothetical protein
MLSPSIATIASVRRSTISRFWAAVKTPSMTLTSMSGTLFSWGWRIAVAAAAGESGELPASICTPFTRRRPSPAPRLPVCPADDELARLGRTLNAMLDALSTPALNL